MTATSIRLLHTGHDLRARRPARKAPTSGMVARIVRLLPVLTVATVAFSIVWSF